MRAGALNKLSEIEEYLGTAVMPVCVNSRAARLAPPAENNSLLEEIILNNFSDDINDNSKVIC